jgi:hypothetical protein
MSTTPPQSPAPNALWSSIIRAECPIRPTVSATAPPATATAQPAAAPAQTSRSRPGSRPATGVPIALRAPASAGSRPTTRPPSTARPHCPEFTAPAATSTAVRWTIACRAATWQALRALTGRPDERLAADIARAE